MTNFTILWDISKTHLLAKNHQTAVAALGVTFGIGIFIIMMGFMTGLNDLLDGLVLNRTPHIQIYNKTEPTEVKPAQSYFDAVTDFNYIHSIKLKARLERVHDASPMLSQLKNSPKVKGATPQTTCKVFYLAGSNNLNGIVNGIDVKEEVRLFNFKDYIVAGDVNCLIKNKNNVLLGAGIAKKLSLSVGDKLQVRNTSGANFSLSIGGIYQSGMAEVDDIQSYVNLKMAQQILGVGGNYVSRIHIKLHDINDAVPMSH